MKKLILSVFVTLAMFACTKDKEKDFTNPKENQNETATYNVPKSQYDIAMDNMMDLLKDVYPEKYSLVAPQKYSLKTDIFTNKHLSLQNRQKTRAISEKALDTLLYIVNFGEDEGFAIMSAKDEGTVYALTDKGNISIDDFTIATDTNHINYEKPSTAVASLVATSLNNENLTPSPDPGTTPDFPIYSYRYTTWTTENTIGPLVRVKFHQYSPYNNECPLRGNPPKTAPAGCGPIAVIQLMSALKYPSTIDDITYDWNIIINNYRNTGHELHTVLAKWIRKIGKQSSVSYGANGSKTTLLLTRLCLLKYDRFSKVNLKYNVSYDNVTDMINSGLPVICQGCQSNAITSGHIWLLDGLIYQYRYKQQIRNNVVVDQTKETRQFIHCNYGWNGDCDGYYNIDLFNTGEGPIFRDNIDTGEYSDDELLDFNYNTCMLTYQFN